MVVRGAAHRLGGRQPDGGARAVRGTGLYQRRVDGPAEAPLAVSRTPDRVVPTGPEAGGDRRARPGRSSSERTARSSRSRSRSSRQRSPRWVTPRRDGAQAGVQAGKIGDRRCGRSPCSHHIRSEVAACWTGAIGDSPDWISDELPEEHTGKLLLTFLGISAFALATGAAVFDCARRWSGASAGSRPAGRPGRQLVRPCPPRARAQRAALGGNAELVMATLGMADSAAVQAVWRRRLPGRT